MRKPFLTGFSNSVPLIILPLLCTVISFSPFVSSQNVDKKICQTKECLSAAQNLEESINFNANPCDDFYEYACGNWPKHHTVSSLLPQSIFSLRLEENSADIINFIKQNNSNDEPEAVHKVRKFFSLCSNEAGYSNKTESIKLMLEKIGLPIYWFESNGTENFDYSAAFAKATKFAGIKTFFDLGIAANPFNRTINLIRLKKPTQADDPDIIPLMKHSAFHKFKRSTNLRNEENLMLEMIKKMCKDSTLQSCKQWNSTQDIMYTKLLNQGRERTQVIATLRSKSSSSIIVVYTLKQLQDITDQIATDLNAAIPTLNWTRYIEEMFTGLDNVTLNLSDPAEVKIVIEELDFVKDMLRFIHRSQDIKTIELRLWWDVVGTLLPYADLEIFDWKNALLGPLSREIRCASITSVSLPMAISYVYASKEKYVKAKAEIRTMFEHIRESLQQIIKEASWMDEMTRQRALQKLQLMKSYILYPSGMKTTSKLNDFYKDVQITDNFYDTMISKIHNQITKRLNRLNQINDLKQDDWTLAPTLVNSFYDPRQNTMIIPAGVIGLSIYNNSLQALDYGAIGSIIGHEMSHAFDNIGRRFNELGNIEDWWQPQTTDVFKRKIECFVKAYENYSTTTRGITQKADSKLTLREDISDNAGFKESLLGYKKYIAVSGEESFLPKFENFTHLQLHTLGFANIWCENPTILSSWLSPYSDHSPSGVRVNGVFRNSKEFSEIWNCTKGSNMNPNQDKCALW